MIWGGFSLMCELEWNRALLTMSSTSGADVSMPTFEPQEDILNILTVTLIMQDIN